MYACLDLGSNSFHLLIARYDEGRLCIIERFSRKVQLGEGVALDGKLGENAVERGLECLRHFREVIDAHPVTCLWSVGTNALRMANNSGFFLRQARELGFDIEVIDGEKEGALVYAGVTSDMPEASVRRLVVDIGGGSTEVILGRGGCHEDVRSLPLGCISWRDRYFRDLDASSTDMMINHALLSARSAAAGVMENAGEDINGNPWRVDEVLASSGTAKMLSLIATAWGKPAGTVSREGLETLFNGGFLHRVVQEPEWSMPGLKPARRDLLLPGWALMTAFMSIFDVSVLQFSRSALREGMLTIMRQHREMPGRAAINARMQWHGGTDG